MRIPSYDDLTPSIPDIAPGDVLASAGTLVQAGGPVASRPAVAATVAGQLFAALHGPAVDTAPPGSADSAAPGRPDLVAIARDFSPRIECHAGGTVVLDIAGLQRLLGGAAAIADQLAQAGAPHVAVAVSHTAAILLARARAGVTVAATDPEAALRDVPLAVLRQWLVDTQAAAARTRRVPSEAVERAFDALYRWGLTVLGEFAALPAAALSARLGPEGLAMQRLARGIDPRPLVPDPGVTRFIGSFELEWPVDTLEPLSFVLARLLEPLADALERADRGAVALHLELRLADRSTHTRTLQLPAPMRDPKVLRTLLLLDLESHPPASAVDAVTVEIHPAPGRVVQYSLLERAVPSPETLATLMARLGALVGEARCGSPVLLDTHRPDGFRLEPVAFPETPWPGDPRARARPRDTAPGRVAQAQPAAPAAALRRFRPPVAVRVTVDRGRPVRVAVDRRGMPGGAVRDAAGPWRTSGGWWEGGRWNRDEWDVAFGDGSVCRLFRDRDSGGWFLDGIVD